MLKIVINTSPLLALSRISLLEILPKLFTTVYRPQAVLDELLEGEEKYGLDTMLKTADWLITCKNPPEQIYHRELGAGETAAIALAVKLQADLIILDDLRARLTAQAIGLKVTGTLGLILSAYKSNLISREDGICKLNTLTRSGFRLPNMNLDTLFDA